jgi:hypothetical protein
MRTRQEQQWRHLFVKNTVRTKLMVILSFIKAKQKLEKAINAPSVLFSFKPST